MPSIAKMKIWPGCIERKGQKRFINESLRKTVRDKISVFCGKQVIIPSMQARFAHIDAKNCFLR